MKRPWKKIIIVVFLVLMIFTGFYYVMKYSTYDTVEIVNTYENKATENGNYIRYLDGILKYGKDGIAMLTKEGEEIWNYPCQMNSPMTEMNSGTVAVADKGGTSILVFQKDGLKGEIQTTRPIEKVTVSGQGIVAAILQDEETPRVMCYDAKGNILVEHKAALASTGYPVDIAISNDGNVLLVSYLGTKGSGVISKTVFYHFGEAGKGKANHQVAEAEYTNTILPVTVFLDKNTSLLVTDHSFLVYEGLDEPKQKTAVELDKEIKSVAYNENYIVFVLKNSGQTDYELRMYTINGKQAMTAEFEGEYTNIKMVGKEIILYSGNICAIFNEKGVCKYEGTMENNIIDIFPIAGLNKYMMISANGFMEIQLAK